MSQNLSDEALMANFYACSDDALGVLYERWGPRLEGFLCRQGLPLEDAEDLSAEVFLRVMATKDRRASRYDPQRARFRTWVGSITRHLLRDRRKRPPLFIRRRTAPGADPAWEIPDDAPSAEEAAEAQERRAVIARCLEDLPERERWVVT